MIRTLKVVWIVGDDDDGGGGDDMDDDEGERVT